MALEKRQDGTLPPLAHHSEERVLVEPLDCRKALRDHLAVAAMAAEGVVVHVECRRLADRGRFLADREMRGPRIVVANVGVAARALEEIEHRLELADDDHVTQHST